MLKRIDVYGGISKKKIPICFFDWDFIVCRWNYPYDCGSFPLSQASLKDALDASVASSVSESI